MKALIKSGLCVALGWLASSAGAQEPLQWKASPNGNSPAAVASAPGAGPAVSLSQPTPLDAGAQTPAPSFRVMPGAPPATVRAQKAEERIFQIEPLLEGGDDKKPPKQMPKDKGFVPPPPTPITPAPAFDNFGMDDGCCNNACNACNACGSRLSGLRGWGGWGGSADRYQAWASAEYLMFYQKGQVTPPLIVANPGGTPTAQTGILGASAVLYDHTPNYSEGGARFGAGVWFPRFCNNLGIEANYFFLARQSSTAVFDSNGDPSLSRPFFDTRGFLNAEPFALHDGVNNVATGSATVHDFTQLWGFDTNLRFKWLRGPNCWVDFLAGYRYLNLTEGIDITEDRFTQIVGTLPLGVHTREVESFHTANQFNGFQVGLDGECRLWDRWFLGFNGKVAMGSVAQSVTLDGSTNYQFPAGLTQFNGTQPGALLVSTTNRGRWTQNSFAVAPEIGLKIGYDLTDHLRVFAGYDFLYLSSVVRPGDQIDLNVNQAFRPVNGVTPGFGNIQNPLTAGPRAPTVLLRTSDYWAQGINFGLMYRY
jgi:hypothetical protein